MRDEPKQESANARSTPTRGPLRGLYAVLLLAAWCTGGAGTAVAADGAALFGDKCAPCHSVGGGSKMGPDLKDVIAKRGMQGAILAIIDPAKAGLGPSMPKLGLTRSEAEAIGVYLEGADARGAAAAGKESPAQAAAEAAAEAAPEVVTLGRKLFEGSVRLAGGGPACNACHHVSHETVTGGGALATDLTLSYSRVGGQGLGAMLTNAPFPAMQIAYEGKAIRPEEIRSLAGFLQRAEKEHAAQPSANYGWQMFFWGAGGLVVLAGFFALLGGRRTKRSVNQDIYDRQVKSE